MKKKIDVWIEKLKENDKDEIKRGARKIKKYFKK